MGAAILVCAAPVQGSGILQTSSAPLSNAEVDEFVELLSGSPLEPELSARSAAAWDEWSNRLKRDNPGRDAEIDDQFQRFSRCATPAVSIAGQDMIRRTIREMGRERVTKIMTFLRRDQARMQELARRLDGSPPLSAREVAELRRLSETYGSGLLHPPEVRMSATETRALNAAMQPCLDAHIAELERRGLLEKLPGARP
jgi:hypothetical protein